MTQATPEILRDRLQNQRDCYTLEPMPELDARKDKLLRLKQALLAQRNNLCDALDQDYGKRSRYDTLISDIMPCITGINHTLKHLKGWMKPERRSPGLLFAPASIKVHYQPLGMIGIVAPWNFPVMLSVGPLIGALAAGNRAMLKLSEFTPNTNHVIRQMLADAFDESEVAVFEGDAELAAEFTRLPFDHLIFTGSTAIGKHVMHAAADNLTPVTLELGGKSPVIIANDIPMTLAVERLIYGKCLNAGQICVSPDYVLVPEGQQEAFITTYQKTFKRMYRKGVASKDYGAVINTRQFDRLQSWMADAKNKGATLTPAHDNAIDTDNRKMVTHLVTNTTDNMTLMQEEIFGPLLPVIGYHELDDAMRYINQRPRPLALYLMSLDKGVQQKVTEQCHSGGMCINESVMHVGADDAPFGGIGPSGMGHYHGHEGFVTFSKAKTVLKQGKFASTRFIHPPYGGLIQRLILKIFMR
ncbi:Coniferyl aldehyde dehydrogenase [BD1-7 clade bacterium]|uniref:Aldehyde dehydrogenase n=1 Tax=BD1-7 clade bacterium TaxID=2029982 RepID=A0A5S9P707_9GAMM|nr:Coniferyl aldehyde dehydrogenase [BD1-7 clade bacterium]CAA0099435.1 Coniferyl aldehyde dehydrogenase [BD1-7 clade bacterium]